MSIFVSQCIGFAQTPIQLHECVPVTQVRADSHDERLDRVRNEVRHSTDKNPTDSKPIFSWFGNTRWSEFRGADDIPREMRWQQWSVFNVLFDVQETRVANVGVDRAQS